MDRSSNRAEDAGDAAIRRDNNARISRGRCRDNLADGCAPANQGGRRPGGIAQHAAAPGERGGPDLSLEQCISSEQEIRQRLVRQWSTFAPADRTECVGEATAGGESSYTDLLTCLQMARDVRNYRWSAQPKD
jgi:hypothetical protein